jgi:homoserine O-acetyltransferase
MEDRAVLEDPYYTRKMHGPYELFDLGDFVLEEDYTLRECKLAYTTFGELHEAKDNAILVTTWCSGTFQI